MSSLNNIFSIIVLSSFFSPIAMGNNSVQPKRKEFTKHFNGSKKDAKQEWKNLGRDKKKSDFKNSLARKSKAEKKQLRVDYKKEIKENKAKLKVEKYVLKHGSDKALKKFGNLNENQIGVKGYHELRKENKQSLKNNKKELRTAKRDFKKGKISQEQYDDVKSRRVTLKDEKYNNKKEYLEKKWSKQAELGDGRLRGKKINRCLNKNPESAPECFQLRAERRTKAATTAAVVGVGLATAGTGVAIGATAGGIAGGAKGYLDSRSGTRLENGENGKSGRQIASKKRVGSTAVGVGIGAVVGGIAGGATHGGGSAGGHAASHGAESVAESSASNVVMETAEHITKDVTMEQGLHYGAHRVHLGEVSGAGHGGSGRGGSGH